MSVTGNVWRFITAFIVFLLLLNPEMIHLAFFIDAIGLELFLLLIQVQFVAIVLAKVQPLTAKIENLLIKRLSSISLQGISYKILSYGTGQSLLMHALVLSAFAGFLAHV